jgi:hypothetical protein
MTSRTAALKLSVSPQTSMNDRRSIGLTLAEGTARVAFDVQVPSLSESADASEVLVRHSAKAVCSRSDR